MTPASRASSAAPRPPAAVGTDTQSWVDAVDIDDVRQIGVQPESTPAFLGFSFNAGGDLLGRAVMTPWAEVPAA